MDRDRLRRLGRAGGLVVAAWLILWGLACYWRGPREVYFVSGGDRPAMVSKDYSSPKAGNDTVLILSPMKNGIDHIESFFRNVDALTYPRSHLELGVLVSDSTDQTWDRLHELVSIRQASPSRFARASLFKKDFDASELENKGKARHGFEVQVQRRALLAKSRSWLLSAAMTPDVEWVLWIDIDVDEYPTTLVQDLIEAARIEDAQVVAPNCMWKTDNDIGPYDRNYWWETPESLEWLRGISADAVVFEGYKEVMDSHRQLLGESYDYKSPEAAREQPHAYRLDGVGGCCTFVHASVHREGAVFPAYVFDHQMETEGFAQMAKRLGKRMVGLPTYHVYHGLYG